MEPRCRIVFRRYTPRVPEETYDIAIVGAGAAGLMAGIWAGRTAEGKARVAALDGAAKVGAKILVSGGGRCNVTHDVVHPHDYFGSSRNAVAKVLRTFTVEQTVAFFAELGVRLKREETGKLFPTTDAARSVLDALLGAMERAGTTLITNRRVERVTKIEGEHSAECSPSEGGGFEVATSQGTLRARIVILATGGKSLPKTGSDGHGYTIAQALGHSVTPTTPALVPLVLKDKHWLTDLSGIALDATLTLTSSTGKVLHKQAGSLLFTHFGISGPAAMDISRHWIAAHAQDAGAKLLCDLARGERFEDVERVFLEKAERNARTAVATTLTRWVPDRFARALCERETGVPADTPLSRLSRDDRRALAHALTALPLPIVRDRGYLFAEVTAGGVPLREVDLGTMASRKCPGLYLCGEVLDVDGRIGGYNYQWAWCSARLAGIAAAKAASQKT